MAWMRVYTYAKCLFASTFLQVLNMPKCPVPLPPFPQAPGWRNVSAIPRPARIAIAATLQTHSQPGAGPASKRAVGSWLQALHRRPRTFASTYRVVRLQRIRWPTGGGVAESVRMHAAGSQGQGPPCFVAARVSQMGVGARTLRTACSMQHSCIASTFACKTVHKGTSRSTLADRWKRRAPLYPVRFGSPGGLEAISKSGDACSRRGYAILLLLLRRRGCNSTTHFHRPPTADR